jgi:hypothetical protein
LTRHQARSQFDLPDFVAHAYLPGQEPGTTSVLLLSAQDPDNVVEVLTSSTHTVEESEDEQP